MVIWLIGLAGSGKTSVGTALAQAWRQSAPNTVLLDGDEMRRLFGHDADDSHYTLAGRRVNAERMAALCELLDRQGINVVCCILSLFPEQRRDNRKRFSRYYEVYLTAPMNVLEQRRTLYNEARAGRVRNVVGVDIDFPPPREADMTLDTGEGSLPPEALAQCILRAAGGMA